SASVASPLLLFLLYLLLLYLASSFFFSLLPPPPTSTLFPYTTLFRSVRQERLGEDRLAVARLEVLVRRLLVAAHVRLEDRANMRSEEHTSELQSRSDLVCRLLLEKKKKKKQNIIQRKHHRYRLGHDLT